MDDKTRGKFTARHPEYVRTARHVIAVSEWTRTDIIEKLGVPEDRVSVVPNAVDERFRPLAPSVDREALRRRLRLPERFLLHVGTLQPRKNLARLIRAHRALLDRGGDVDLVLCGQDAWLEDEIIEEAASPRSRGRVQIRRDVHDDDLVGVYNLAEVFVMPSLLEGFGIPVLEAMACGTPVVSSHAGALAEVAGDAAILIDPEDEDGLSKAIQEVLDSPDLRERLRARGLERAAAYSWDASAAELARILDEIDRTDHGENS